MNNDFELSHEEIKKELFKNPPNKFLSFTELLSDDEDDIKIEPDKKLLSLIEYIDNERSCFDYDREIEAKNWKNYVLKIVSIFENDFMFDTRKYSPQKFLVVLFRKKIISNLYLPPSIKINKNKDNYSFDTTISQYAGADMALNASIRSPQQFNDSIVSFKFNDWSAYLKIRDEYLEKIVKNNIKNIKTTLIKDFYQLFKNFKNEYEFASKKGNFYDNLKINTAELIAGCDTPDYNIQNFLLTLKDWGLIKDYDFNKEDNNYAFSLPRNSEKLERKINMYDIVLDSLTKKESNLDIDYSPQINYNCKTGTGHTKLKKFKFKNHQPEFRVFAEMYKNINNPIVREKVLQISVCKELGEDRKTYFINELAKKMRKRTGLTKDDIVNNNGDLTLVAESVENAPN